MATCRSVGGASPGHSQGLEEQVYPEPLAQHLTPGIAASAVACSACAWHGSNHLRLPAYLILPGPFGVNMYWP